MSNLNVRLIVNFQFIISGRIFVANGEVLGDGTVRLLSIVEDTHSDDELDYVAGVIDEISDPDENGVVKVRVGKKALYIPHAEVQRLGLEPDMEIQGLFSKKSKTILLVDSPATPLPQDLPQEIIKKQMNYLNKKSPFWLIFGFGFILIGFAIFAFAYHFLIQQRQFEKAYKEIRK
jgi:hypothetical protein